MDSEVCGRFTYSVSLILFEAAMLRLCTAAMEKYHNQPLSGALFRLRLHVYKKFTCSKTVAGNLRFLNE
mgnify:CR=1 FL=1